MKKINSNELLGLGVVSGVFLLWLFWSFLVKLLILGAILAIWWYFGNLKELVEKYNLFQKGAILFLGAKLKLKELFSKLSK